LVLARPLVDVFFMATFAFALAFAFAFAFVVDFAFF
jgi:hypothetical protein